MFVELAFILLGCQGPRGRIQLGRGISCWPSRVQNLLEFDFVIFFLASHVEGGGWMLLSAHLLHHPASYQGSVKLVFERCPLGTGHL